MAAISYILFSRNCLLINKTRSFQPNVCTNCTKDLMPAGHISIMIRSRVKKYSLPNTAEMERKAQEKKQSILSMLFQDPLHQMGYYSILVISFRKNIETEHLSLSTVPGTGRRSPRKVFMWLLYLSVRANHPGNGKYLQMV